MYIDVLKNICETINIYTYDNDHDKMADKHGP